MNSFENFSSIYRTLYLIGRTSSPRGLLIKELEHYSYVLGPYERFINFKDRKLNLDYIKKEFLWYLRGDRYDMSICDEAKIWNQVKKKDKNGNWYLNSNYGYYVFTKGGLQRVISELIKDKDSRRASISILGSEPEHWEPDATDVPCTYSLNFRIRDNKLNMSVHMRSQDAIYGMGNDAPCFSMIHEIAFVYLKAHYPELEMGNYYHTADSFHVYERHFKMLDKLAFSKHEDFEEIDVPKISCVEECDFLLTSHQNSEISIPKSYMFTRWLLNV